MTTIERGPRATDRFAIISNDALADGRLSYRARGVLAYLLSRPPGWRTNSETLATQGREGRDAIRTALRELADTGYLVRTRTRDDAGKWVHISRVDDHPQTAAGQPGDGKPGAGEPSPDDQAISSKTETKTESNSSAPAERPGTVPPGLSSQAATKVYDATGGGVPFMAARNVAGRVITARKWEQDVEGMERTAAAMVDLYHAGKPLTVTTVCQVLDGALRLNGTGSALAQRDRQAFTEDWASGAAEASWRALDGAR